MPLWTPYGDMGSAGAHEPIPHAAALQVSGSTPGLVLACERVSICMCLFVCPSYHPNNELAFLALQLEQTGNPSRSA